MGEAAQRLARLMDSVRECALGCGRNPEDIKVVLVTKKVSVERILEAYDAGVRDFAENRVQELQEKKEKLPQDIRWHMIGHLQTNKVKDVLGLAVLIHSLDRRELALEIQKQAVKRSIPSVECLIQVNSSGEQTKYGLALNEVEGALREFMQPLIHLRGFMTIGPLSEDREKIREAFRTVRLLREKLSKKFPGEKFDILSMGMSGDYKIAIEEGATLLRIGSAVFGARR